MKRSDVDGKWLKLQLHLPSCSLLQGSGDSSLEKEFLGAPVGPSVSTPNSQHSSPSRSLSGKCSLQPPGPWAPSVLLPVLSAQSAESRLSPQPPTLPQGQWDQPQPKGEPRVVRAQGMMSGRASWRRQIELGFRKSAERIGTNSTLARTAEGSRDSGECEERVV